MCSHLERGKRIENKRRLNARIAQPWFGAGGDGNLLAMLVVQGAKALISKNWRHPTGGRLGDGVQGRAKSPLGHGGVGGAGMLRLTGDATAIRCTGFDDLRNRCPCLHRRHLGKRMEIRRGRLAGGDATGHAQRVPLAKVAMVLPSTPCGSRYRVIWLLRSR